MINLHKVNSMYMQSLRRVVMTGRSMKVGKLKRLADSLPIVMLLPYSGSPDKMTPAMILVNLNIM